jgi:hypothetical protein
MAMGVERFVPYGAIAVADQNGASGARERRMRSGAALR